MKIYTAHAHPRHPTVLVVERFSWGAFLFGPLWLLRHRAWIAGAIAAALLAAVCTLAPPFLRPALAFVVFAVLGFNGNDLRRWSLGLGRFQLVHIVAARGRDDAFLRLLSHDPALLARAL